MHHRLACALLIGCLHAASPTRAQQPLESWLQNPIDAGAWGTGGAGSAVLGPFVGMYNPGGLGVYALTGQSAYLYADHGDLESDGENVTNAVVLSSPAWTLGRSPRAPRIALGATYRDQLAMMYIPHSPGPPSDYRAHVHAYTFGVGFDYGIQVGAGFAYERYWNSMRDDHANSHDIGLYARLPVLAAVTRYGWLRQRPAWESITPELIVTVSHAWTRRGLFASGKELSGGRLLGLSAEAVLSYQRADIIRVLYTHDFLVKTRNVTDIRRAGLRLDLLGFLQIMQGDFGPPENTDLYETDAISYHSRGLVQWLGIAFPRDPQPRWQTVLEAMDIYYTTASYDETSGTSAIVNEFGVVVDAGKLFWNR